jgi:proteasome lid subunit RPN8/RPN11
MMLQILITLPLVLLFSFLSLIFASVLIGWVRGFPEVIEEIKLGDFELEGFVEVEPPSVSLGFQLSPVGKIVGTDIGIYVEEKAMERMREHALSDTSREVGGVLVGEVHIFRGKKYVKVEDCLEAKYAVGEAARIVFTHDTWREVSDEMDRKFPGKRIVGWYHSHPRYGIFLSSRDLFIHKNFFNEEWHVALVIDPISGEQGFFQWRGGEIERCGGFYIYSKPGND